MKTILISWVGATDLRAPKESETTGVGPIAQALEARQFDEAVLICDYPQKKTALYIGWLKKRCASKIHINYVTLSSPTHFGQIYEAATGVIDKLINKHKNDIKLSFHLSPGTPAMAAVWIILGKTRFPAELIESSRTHGVQTASVPFEISADFIPDLLSGPDRRLKDQSAGVVPETPEFTDIKYQSQIMQRLVAKARKVAPRSVPVLIEGESGTGKELLARAIHRASPRKEGPFVAVNCGAIPENLLESELFGHTKGAFTGAGEARKGYFEEAHGGTLFLDEIGELPLMAQVKILRALQENEIVRVGATKPVKIDIRIIAATNRTLSGEITEGRFRSDLFYRIAVAVLKLPPLRERQGDLSLLMDWFLEKTNAEGGAEEPGYVHKKISAGAKNLMLQHDWPGNIRELQNTILRAAIWSEGPSIRKEDIKEALIAVDKSRASDILERPLGEGLNLQEIIANVSRHYLLRALEEAHGNKTQAAELLGLPSYQTLTNWLDKYGVK